METFSALLAICAGNSPVSGEFPAQRPVTRSFDVFFDLRPNKRLSKPSWGWWFETPSHPLWCDSNVYCIISHCTFPVIAVSAAKTGIFSPLFWLWLLAARVGVMTCGQLVPSLAIVGKVNQYTQAMLYTVGWNATKQCYTCSGDAYITDKFM